MVRNNVVVLLNYMTTKSGYVSNKGHYHSLENWVNNGKVLDYLTRSDKCCVFNDNDLKESYEFNSDAARKEYMRNHIKENVKCNKKSGLYNLMADKPIDIKDIDVLKREFKNLKQTCWDLVINPGDLGLENNMLHKNKWHEIIKPYFEKLLIANGFDPKNINCFYAMDGNTQYPHVELFFYEKEPTRVKGNFKLETLNIFKGQIANAIGNSDFVNKLNDLTKDVWDARKLILNNVNKLLVKQRNQEKLNDDPKQDYVDFLKASKFITDELKNKHNKSYARLSDEAKNQIEVIKNFLYQKDPTYKEAVDDYQKKIDLIRSLNTDGDKYLEKRINGIIKKEQDDFEEQIGNKIIKALQEARKESKEISNKYDAGQFISNFLDFFSFDNNSNKLMKLAEKEFEAKTVRELELLHKHYRAKL